MKGPNEGDESWRLAKFKEIHEPEKKFIRSIFLTRIEISTETYLPLIMLSVLKQ